MNKPNPAPEPSMEEILASIRRIISDDGGASPADKADDEAEVDAQAEANDAVAEVTEEAGGDSADTDIFDLTDDMVAEEPDAGEEEADEEEAGDDDMDVVVAVKAEPSPVEEEAAAPADIFDSLPADLVEPDEIEVEFGAAEKVVEQEPEPEPEPMAAEAGGGQKATGTGLLSPQSDAAVSAAFGRLASTILTHDARTLEDLVGDMLRPILKEWLDDNLPVLVERLVREEIERVSRGRR